MGAKLIDPTRDKVWAVDVTINFTTFVVAETAREAERIAEDEEGEPHYAARELTAPLGRCDPDSSTVPYGRSCSQGRDLTVNEALELVADHKPAYDHQTLLMPFAEVPPPLYPRQIDDYLAGGRCTR